MVEMTDITVFGGIHEVGGNTIVISSKNTRILVDFGISFNRHRKYFSRSLTPRTGNYLGDLLEFQLIPDFSGLYKQDLIRNNGKKPLKEPAFDAVVFSHVHLDHCGYLGLVRSDIPIYCSLESLCILENLAITGLYQYSEFIATKPSFRFKINKKGGVSRMTSRDGTEKREFKILEKGKSNKIGDFTISPFPVDHSLPGAMGFVIDTPSGSIAYSGDIRFHGRHPEYSHDFVERTANFEPEIMLCEGTRITEDKNTGENEVEHATTEILRVEQDLAIVNFPQRDIDRLISFHKSAKKSGRELLINLSQAHLLELLHEKIGGKDVPDLEDDGISLYAEPKGWFHVNKREILETELSKLVDSDHLEENVNKQLLMDYDKWERKYISNEELTVRTAEVKKKQSKYLLYCPYSVFEHLIDIHPDRGTFIWSKTIPFTDEMELDKTRLDHWSQHFGLKRVSLHASGHASGPDLKMMIEKIKPKNLLPVHSTAGGSFNSFHGSVIYPKRGEKYSF
ncbi:MAG: MBL fold metallo-hydrolase [Candidatus Hodarchaeales archaeon]